MKNIFIILTLMFCSTVVFGQKYSYYTGGRFIRKADKNLKKGNLPRVEKLIAKAKRSHFGYCGTEALRRESEIGFIELQVLLKQKKFDKALVLLDSTYIGENFNSNVRDSLKVIILFSKYGKEKVRNSFKNVTKINERTGFFGQILYYVTLKELNYVFCFEEKWLFDKMDKVIQEVKTKNEFYDKAKNTAFYKLIE